MVTKGIITSIDFNGNTCKVRVPFFETAGNDPIIGDAIISNTPGMYNGYKVGDVVLVAFEDGQMDNPVVIGKLYLGAEKEKADPRGSLNTEILSASKTASVPSDTKLTMDTDKNLPNTMNPYANLSSIANNLNKLNTDVTYLDAFVGNQFRSVITDADGLRSLLQQTAAEIRAETVRKNDLGEDGFGWSLTTDGWKVYNTNSAHTYLKDIGILTVDPTGVQITGDLKILDYPKINIVSYLSSSLPEDADITNTETRIGKIPVEGESPTGWTSGQQDEGRLEHWWGYRVNANAISITAEHSTPDYSCTYVWKLACDISYEPQTSDDGHTVLKEVVKNVTYECLQASSARPPKKLRPTSDRAYVLAQGKSTNYYSQFEPYKVDSIINLPDYDENRQTDPTSINEYESYGHYFTAPDLATGDCWFNTNNNYVKIQTPSTRDDYNAKFIKVNDEYIQVNKNTTGITAGVTECYANHHTLLQCIAINDDVHSDSYGKATWEDIGGELTANKITTQYLNALDITAKKLHILDKNNKTLFLANGLDPTNTNNQVTIAGWTATNNKLTAGQGSGAISIQSDSSFTADGHYYRIVKYVESHGQEYIDTGYVPNSSTAFSVTYQTTKQQDSTDAALMGYRQANKSGGAFIIWARNAQEDANTELFALNVNETGWIVANSCPNQWQKHTVILTGGTASFDDGTLFASNIPSLTNENDITLALFGLKANDTVDIRRFYGKIYECSIYENNVLVKHYIPALKDENEYGLWETVNSQFYGNDGSGAFTGEVYPYEFDSIYLGSEESASAPFRVTNTGKLFATGGEISGFNINDHAIYKDITAMNDTAHDTGIYIGTDGIRIGSGFKVSSGGSPVIADYTKEIHKKYCRIKENIEATAASAHSWWNQWNPTTTESGVIRWQTAIPDRANEEYIWEWTKAEMGDDTTDPATWTDQGKICKTADSPYTLDIKNPFVGAPYSNDGNTPGWDTTTFRTKTLHKLIAYCGNTKITDTITIRSSSQGPTTSGFSIIPVSTNATITNGFPQYNSTDKLVESKLDAVSADNGSVEYTLYVNGEAVATATFEIVKNKVGEEGEPAVSYWISLTPDAVQATVDGNGIITSKSPANVSVEFDKQIGTGNPTKIVTADNLYYTTKYDGGTESTKTKITTNPISIATSSFDSSAVITIYSNNTSSAVKCASNTISVIKDGKPGSGGRSVLSVTKYYKLATSEPAIPYSKDPEHSDHQEHPEDAGWYPTPAAWESGKNYYESDRTTYDTAVDGKDYSWSNVVMNSMLTVDFINSLGITADAIRVPKTGTAILSANIANESAGAALIGGFTVDATRLRNGLTSFNDSAHSGVYLGTDGIGLGSQFRVSTAGELNATNAVMSGTIDANRGTIGAFTIEDDSLSTESVSLATKKISVWNDVNSISLDASTSKPTILFTGAGEIALKDGSNKAGLVFSANGTSTTNNYKVWLDCNGTGGGGGLNWIKLRVVNPATGNPSALLVTKSWTVYHRGWDGGAITRMLTMTIPAGSSETRADFGSYWEFYGANFSGSDPFKKGDGVDSQTFSQTVSSGASMKVMGGLNPAATSISQIRTQRPKFTMRGVPGANMNDDYNYFIYTGQVEKKDNDNMYCWEGTYTNAGWGNFKDKKIYFKNLGPSEIGVGDVQSTNNDGGCWYKDSSSAWHWISDSISNARITNIANTWMVSDIYTIGTDAMPWASVHSILFYGEDFYRGYLPITATPSDVRLKTNITYDISKYDAVFDALKPASFMYTEGTSNRRHLGLMAQDLQQTIDENNISRRDFAAIVIGGDGFDKLEDKIVDADDITYGINYAELQALEIRQIQLLKKRVEELERKLNNKE